MKIFWAFEQAHVAYLTGRKLQCHKNGQAHYFDGYLKKKSICMYHEYVPLIVS
ncbi:MAG: hypothetical protein JW915_20455 [Chitinispirillaceae bacterium]|nr:hypothetical protein [Chitinispirillaceae bacterium]